MFHHTWKSADFYEKQPYKEENILIWFEDCWGINRKLLVNPAKAIFVFCESLTIFQYIWFQWLYYIILLFVNK